MKRKPWIMFMAIIVCSFMAFGLIGCVSQEDIDAAVDETTKPYLQQVADLEAEKAELEEDKADLEEQNGELEEYVDELEAQIEELKRINCLSGKHVADLDYNSTFVWADDYSTCTATGFCVNCEEEFTETADKSYDSGLAVARFTCGLESDKLSNVIDATDLTFSSLIELYVEALMGGELDFHITITEDRQQDIAGMITAVLNMPKGILSLTLVGIKTMSNDFSDASMLKKVSLPDALRIEENAFNSCDGLTEIYAPKVQTVGKYAFSNTAIESIDLPEALTVSDYAFYNCKSLTSVKLPKAKIIGADAFGGTALSTLILLAKDDIELGKMNNLKTEDVSLVLDVSKQDEVDVREWSGYTFKSIRFACVDGTTNHTYESISSNNNDTHTFDCATCDETVTECCYGGEATGTKRAECEACGAEHGEFAEHITDPDTDY